MNTWARLRLWTLDHQRWFAIWSMFSLFGLFALLEGDMAWLGCLGFLGFLFYLAPQRGERELEHAEGRPNPPVR